jgi:hypothetical protein
MAGHPDLLGRDANAAEVTSISDFSVRPAKGGETDGRDALRQPKRGCLEDGHVDMLSRGASLKPRQQRKRIWPARVYSSQASPAWWAPTLPTTC